MTLTAPCSDPNGACSFSITTLSYPYYTFNPIPGPPWLTINPASGTVACGATLPISITVDPSQLAGSLGQVTSVGLNTPAGMNVAFYDPASNQFGSWNARAWYWLLNVSLPPPPPPPSPDHGPCKECEGRAGLPINLGTGDVWITKTDYSVPGLAGGLTVTRTWNSLWQYIKPTSPAPSPVFQVGMFGKGWISDLEERLQILDANANQVKYWRADGNGWIFGSNGGGLYSILNPGDAHAILNFDSNAQLYTMTFPDGTTKTFDNNGYLLSWKDRNGNATTITRSGAQVTQVTAPGGQSVGFTYGSGLVTSAQDSVGTVATYNYSGTLLTSVTYPDGSAVQYGYDGNSSIVSVLDAQGKTLETHSYDSQGHGLTSAKANGVEIVSVQYPDPAMGSSTLTDSKGNVSTFSFNIAGGRNRVNSITGTACASCGYSPALEARLDYDSSGNVIHVVDANQHVKYLSLDGNSNLTRSLEFVGNQNVVHRFIYNNFSEVTDAFDPLGNDTTSTYDANGNLLSVTAPSPDGVAPGPTTNFHYDPKGELIEVDDPLGNPAHIAYTPGGLIQSITDAQNNVTTYQYDGRGNRTSVIDANHQTTIFAYDSMNRLTDITYPDNSTNHFTYDLRGRRTSVKDGNGKTTQYAYDDADRLVSVTDAAGNATTYSYDTESNLTNIIDAANHTTTFSYDSMRRVISTTFPSGLSETYAYDPVSNLSGKNDRNGKTISYGYDELHRLLSKSFPDSTAVNYAYDISSNLTQVTDPTGTDGFTYDYLNRLTQTSIQYSFLSGQTLTNKYTYDAASNRVSFTNPQGGVTHYAYDPLNRLSSVIDFANRTFGFSYDFLSRRTGLTRPNGVNTTYNYDSMSRLLSVLHQSGSTTLDGDSYTYDGAGNRISKTPLPGALTYTYGYDPIYELLQATRSSDGHITEKYTYDAVGNRLTSPGAPYTYNTSNELTAREGVPYTYDNDGNTLTKGSGTGTTTYAWDFENRLASVTLPASGGTITFKYDPFGRRIYKAAPAGTTMYVYDGANAVEELTGTGTVDERYTFGPGTDEPLVGQRQPLIFYYEADGLGSVTSLTNPTGAVAATYTYDSFGFITNSTGTATNWYRYTARQFDSATGLYYDRARYYDPIAGRFLNEDPIGLAGGINAYPYAENLPTTLNDPSGLSGQDSSSAQTNAVAAGLQRILDLLPSDTKCEKFLCQPGEPHPIQELQDLLKFRAFGVAPIPPGTDQAGHPIMTNALSNGYVEGQAITVNSIGAFFNGSYDKTTLTTDRGKIPGGSSAAQGFILLHELSHLLNAIQPDFNNQAKVDQNDKTIEKNCKALIKALGGR